MELKTPIIPWNEFLGALEKQQPAQAQLWLRRWQFSDSGAILADRRSRRAQFPMLRWLPALARKSFVSRTVAEPNERFRQRG
jgi:hypothetical protein